MNKNYATISPSALSLLKMKAHTTIPFAREAAMFFEKKDDVTASEKTVEDFYYWMRVFHFESRYTSINNLLSDIRPANILELSSGYSFRGLDYCMHNQAHYIDTDLPGLIEVKTHVEKELIQESHALQGKLETLALNALDEYAFDKIVTRFDEQPLTIVNEGLLMYLNTEEKKRLCGIIHKHLSQKGGYWITADIYIRSPENQVRNLKMSKEQEAFFIKHNIDENKFESEAAAKDFFNSQGLVINKVARVDPAALSSYHSLLQHVPEEIRKANKPMPTIQNTWRLQVSG